MLDYVENSFLMTDPSTLSLSHAYIYIHRGRRERARSTCISQGQERRVHKNCTYFVTELSIKWGFGRIDCGLWSNRPAPAVASDVLLLRLTLSVCLSHTPFFLVFAVSYMHTLFFCLACMHAQNEREREMREDFIDPPVASFSIRGLGWLLRIMKN